MSDNCSFTHLIWHKTYWKIVFIFYFLISSCISEFPKPIKDFYYPIDQLESGLVYVYETQTNGSFESQNYWLFESDNLDEGTYLKGRYYDSTLSKGQSFRQKILPSGVLLDRYDLFIPVRDSIEVVSMDVAYRNVFPFEAKDTSTIYLYQVSYRNPQDSSLNTITRNRRFKKSLEWEYNGHVYPAIEIGLLEQIVNEKEGAVTIDLKGSEIYAKGIGLLFSERISLDGTTRIVDKLLKRVPYEEMQSLLSN